MSGAEAFASLPRWQRRALKTGAFVFGWVVAAWVPNLVLVFGLGVMAGLALAEWSDR